MLSIDNLYFKIDDLSILDGISFSVSKGERLGIIGPNGSGKKTLFNCLSGFHFPTSGKIFLNDKDITRTPSHVRATIGLGRVFQNFGIFRQMTLLENVVTALESKENILFDLFGTKNRRLKSKALDFLGMVKLSDKASQKAGSLSGGQMRLLEIVRSIAFGADIFLLDEPTAGVSPKMKDEVEQLLNKLHELEKTILIIEHDINFIQRLCDRIIVLDVGRIVLDGLPDTVRRDPKLQEIYFGNNNSHASIVSSQK